jgi:hypothetical protein
MLLAVYCFLHLVQAFVHFVHPRLRRNRRPRPLNKPLLNPGGVVDVAKKHPGRRIPVTTTDEVSTFPQSTKRLERLGMTFNGG